MGILAIGGTLRAVGGTLRVVGQADPVDPPPPDPVETVLEEGDGLVTVESLAEMPALAVTAGDELVTVGIA